MRLTEEYLTRCEEATKLFTDLYVGYNLCGIGVKSVHLKAEAFLSTFEDYETLPETEKHDRVVHVRNGIAFFALVPKTQEETQ